ncbi:MAG: proteasome-activating nucleotidase [Candidatus Thermoplasmatota archaeon]|nr:proteasome-activating nucleotidase [Candidatus Thermoplasmatota archaeon]
MDEDDLTGTSKELTQRIEELQKKHEELSREYESSDKSSYLKTELKKLKKETQELKKELTRLKKPPLLVGLVKELLPEDKAVIESSTGPDFIVNVADFLPGRELKPGTRVALNKQTLSVVEVLPPPVDPDIMGAEVVESPQLSYDDIGGLREQKREVKETIEEPLLRPGKYKGRGIDPPKAVLLVGPPGTGKTMMAKAVANTTNATFIKLVGSELVQKYIGEGARMVRELFEMAREKSPSIIFIDELDSVATKRQERATSGDREVQRTMMQLLSELDGFSPLGDVKIIGATNRPKLLDRALLRPGRFDRIIETPKPGFEERKAIFDIHMQDMESVEDIDVSMLANRTEEASGADIKAICTEAGMFSIRKDKDKIDRQDFYDAIDKVLGDSPQRKIKKEVMYA